MFRPEQKLRRTWRLKLISMCRYFIPEAKICNYKVWHSWKLPILVCFCFNFFPSVISTAIFLVFVAQHLSTKNFCILYEIFCMIKMIDYLAVVSHCSFKSSQKVSVVDVGFKFSNSLIHWSDSFSCTAFWIWAEFDDKFKDNSTSFNVSAHSRSSSSLFNKQLLLLFSVSSYTVFCLRSLTNVKNSVSENRLSCMDSSSSLAVFFISSLSNASFDCGLFLNSDSQL